MTQTDEHGKKLTPLTPNILFDESALEDAINYWNALPPEQKVLTLIPRRFGKSSVCHKEFVLLRKCDPSD